MVSHKNLPCSIANCLQCRLKPIPFWELLAPGRAPDGSGLPSKVQTQVPLSGKVAEIFPAQPPDVRYPRFSRILRLGKATDMGSDIWVCLKIGYIPNEIAIFHRDNDQQNHWVFRGTQHFQTHPYKFQI